MPEQAREPAPKEKCCMPVDADSTGGVTESSHRSGLNVEAEGPKWDMSFLCQLRIRKCVSGNGRNIP